MTSHGVLAVVAALTLSACSKSPSAEVRLADVEAENEERDDSPIYLTPNIAVYTR